MTERQPKEQAHPKAFVNGDVAPPLVVKDPAKVAKAKQANQKRIKQAMKNYGPPQKALPVRTEKGIKQARKNLERRRKRGVVKNDWGLTNREERLQRRIQVLEKRLNKRHAHRNRKHVPSKPVDPASVEMMEEAPGESWWGGLLDSALELAPSILPMVAAMGDYEIADVKNQTLPKSNSIAACFSEGEMCGEVPIMHTEGNKVRFSHREYLGDVYSQTSSFVATRFPINVGMNESFPWGSRSMSNFEIYELLGALVVFESEGSEYANSVGLGYTGIAAQYDSHENPFLSKKEMMQNQFAVARKPSESFANWLECDPSVLASAKKYVRSGPVPSGADINNYDHCVVTVAVGGMSAAGVIIGELWITYDVLVTLPKSDESQVQSSLYCLISGFTTTSANPLGATQAYGARSTWTPKAITPTSFTFPDNFPAGAYALSHVWAGTAQTAVVVEANPAISANRGTFQDTVPVGLGAAYTLGNGNNVSASGFITTFNHDGTNGVVITYGTAGVIPSAPCVLYLNIWQMPIPPSQASPMFDVKGREAEERYQALMATLGRAQPNTLGVVVRTGRDSELRKSSSGYALFDTRALGSSVGYPLTAQEAEAMLSAPDYMFDKLAANFLSGHDASR